MPFQISGYDPQSIQLYSKCARNQVSTLNPRKRPATASKINKKSLHPKEQMTKKAAMICSFDMLETREQRLKKYKPENTPAIGQYNPKLTYKPKLTWDILKVYNLRQNAKVKKQEKALRSTEKQLQDKQHLLSEMSEELLQPRDHNNIKKRKNTKYKKTQNNNSQRYDQESKRYHTVKSQVDMSRMTGRKNNFNHTLDRQYESQLNVDLNKSIQITKAKNSIKVDFNKQLSREKVNSLNKSQVVPSDYTYDYKVIKPRYNAQVKFDKLKSRDSNQQQNASAYSYAHYDYDEYVWGGKSNVYPNTKTSVIDFNKERGRY